MSLRNIAIIAHVDHGKTTLIDVLLRQSGSFRDNQKVAERAMDSNDLERERGITILAKVTSLVWKDTRINIVDTPGHADFGGEVERILNMVDGAVVLVDASEGPMPQTKFVLQKALKRGIRPIVAINKIDRPDERHQEVLNEVFDLFAALDATEEQLDFPVLYGSAKQGWMSTKPDGAHESTAPLFDLVLVACAAAGGRGGPAPPARHHARGQPLSRPHPDRPHHLGHDPAQHAGEGAVARRQGGRGGPHLQGARLPRPRARADRRGRGGRHRRHRRPHEGHRRRHHRRAGGHRGDRRAADRPADAVDDLPHQRRPARRARRATRSRAASSASACLREAEGNVALKITTNPDNDSFEVAGRGELQLGILIETMRREGFELTIGKPRVVYPATPTDGTLLEPIEEVIIDVDSEHSGIVVQKLSERRAELLEMRPSGGRRTRLVFHAPTRGLIGYQSELLSDTRGTAVFNRLFHEYAPYKGDIPGRRNGVLISNGQGESTNYALWYLEERGALLIDPGIRVYEGMIVGEHSRGNDLEVNVLKGKQLS